MNNIKSKGLSYILKLNPKTTANKRKKIIKKKLLEGEKNSKPSKVLKSKYKDRVYYINDNSNSLITILYLHGGAYCNDLTLFHWLFLKELVKKTNVKIIVPDYHLIPFGTYQEAIDLIIPIYKEINNKKVIIMGDSSGGGLALSILLYLRKNNIKLPNEVILISPWLDISLSNKEIGKFESSDKMLDKSGLIVAGDMWRNKLSNKDWLVSPIYGDFNGISNITTFVGTNEIFYPDVIKLYNKLDKENKLIIGKNMPHAYPIIPINKENGIDNIIDIIKSS